MDLIEAVRAAPAVVPEGGRTHWEVGGPPPAGVAVRAPAGVVAYDPADLTVTAGAGTTVAELDAALGAAGQECTLDPRSDAATLGGVLACGLSGHRRLRHGPLRDAVLEVRAVTGDGRLVKGGGPTVKNVTGYDLPRLLVGSFGTLAVLAQVTLRCRPIARVRQWAVSDRPPQELRATLFRPSSLLWDGASTHVLLEGEPADVDAEVAGAGLRRVDGPPRLPDGAHRGRISVGPSTLEVLGAALAATPGCRWLAEVGVGTVHVACDDATGLGAARAAAHAHGGWLLREAGGDGGDGFGVPLPDAALHRRLKDAFDPEGKLNPGRMPLP